VLGAAFAVQALVGDAELVEGTGALERGGAGGERGGERFFQGLAVVVAVAQGEGDQAMGLGGGAQLGGAAQGVLGGLGLGVVGGDVVEVEAEGGEGGGIAVAAGRGAQIGAEVGDGGEAGARGGGGHGGHGGHG